MYSLVDLGISETVVIDSESAPAYDIFQNNVYGDGREVGDEMR